MTEKKKMRTVKEEPLQRRNKLLFLKDQKKADLIEPVLFLMRADRTVDVYEDVSQGDMEVTIGSKKGETGLIHLAPDKLHSIRWGKTELRAWIAYENEAVPYPQEVLHDSVQLEKIVRGITLTFKEYRDKREDVGDMWQKIIIGVALLLAVLALLGGMDAILPSPAPVQTVAETTVVAMGGWFA